MSDLIERQKAIDAINEALIRVFVDNGKESLGERVLKNVPSAQPEIEERTAESAQNVPKEDLISRKAAIDALKRISFLHLFECGEYLSEDTRVIEIISSSKALEAIEALPSAQPEKRTEERMETHACDCISRKTAIDAAIEAADEWDGGYSKDRDRMIRWALLGLPSAQPEPCKDAVSRNAIIRVLNTMDRYVSSELTLCDTDKKFPKNEVFVVDDVYEEIVEKLPPAQLEIIHCGDCIHAIKDGLCGGYWCKGKAVTSNHYCGYAERRTDE